MNFFNFIRETHKASPTINAIVVEVVGAIPIEHASAAFGIIKLIFEALISSLSEFEEIPIIEIEYFLAKFKRFINSLLLPELEIIISASFFEIMPKSP